MLGPVDSSKASHGDRQQMSDRVKKVAHVIWRSAFAIRNTQHDAGYCTLSVPHSHHWTEPQRRKRNADTSIRFLPLSAQMGSRGGEGGVA